MSYKPESRTPLSTPTLFKSAYSEKLRVVHEFPENSRWTKQSFKDECDINTIMSRYMRTGEMPMINVSYPQYMDCTAMDFESHMQFIAGAQSMFNELPSDIRNRFKNDPAAFLDFCSDEKNRPELAQMGLLSADAMRSIAEAQNAPSVAPAPLAAVPSGNPAPDGASKPV